MIRTADGLVMTMTTKDGDKVRTVTETTTRQGTVRQVHTRYVGSDKPPKSRI
jgi:hypothetical protein